MCVPLYGEQELMIYCQCGKFKGAKWDCNPIVLLSYLTCDSQRALVFKRLKGRKAGLCGKVEWNK